MATNPPLLFRTLPYEKLRQVIARLVFRFRPVRLRGRNSFSQRVVLGPWALPPAKPKSMIGAMRFHLLNQEIQIQKAADWNDERREKQLLYHLHYFDDLNAKDASQRVDWHYNLIEQWIDDNPVLVGYGWEPYALSLRIVNWIKWQRREGALSERALASLRDQARVLNRCIEHHLLADHIFANTKALCFAGYFFNGDEADQWKQRGKVILRVQLDEQILPDGGHFELSPMYHAVMLEDILDLINLFRSYDDNSVASLKPLASGMLRWLQLMTHPDDFLSYFNDSTAGVAATYSSLRDYADRLAVDIPDVSLRGLTPMSDSGYVRYDDDSLAVIIDVGRIGPDGQPEHGHCDCLSFELSCRGKRALVNTGISTYDTNGRRLQERSTAAHNTVSIESTEQSEISNSVRVGRRALPLNVSVKEKSVHAAHDGFSVIAGVTHRREFVFTQDKLEITDLLGRNDVDVFRGTAHFHFHPQINVNVIDDHVEFDDMTINFSNHQSIALSDYEYCQGFSKTETAKVVSVEFPSRLVTEIMYASH